MTRTPKVQIGAIGESRSLWYALRRHRTEAQCAEWLNILHSNSTWYCRRGINSRLTAEGWVCVVVNRIRV